MYLESSKIHRRCDFCGASFLADPPTSKRRLARFCNPSCVARGKRRRMPLPLHDRVMAKVNKSGDIPVGRPDLGACWLWLAALDRHGYGVVRDGKGRAARAHRVVYELLVDEIPDGLVLDHLCNVHFCCNPAHLEPVSQTVNVQRAAKMAAPRTICQNDHSLEDANAIIIYGGKRRCAACVLAGQQRFNEWRRERRRST